VSVYSKYYDKSKRDFFIDIKHIWKILLPERDSKGRIDDTVMPYAVRHLTSRIDASKEKKDPNRTLTLDEIERLIKSFNNDPRLQFYVSIMFESFVRPQELLYCQIKDIQLHDNYAFIGVSEHGKEGTKMLKCFDSYPYLVRWLNTHPRKNDPESYIFINLGDTNRYKQMTPANINKHIKKKLVLLKINKPITNYSLKRTGITLNYASGKTPAEIQYTAGWKSTKQLQTYDNTAQKDVFERELIRRGLKKAPEGYKGEVSMTKKCLFCEHINPLSNEMCDNCKRPLDREKLIKQQEDHEKALQKIMLIQKNITKQELRLMVRDILKKELKK